MSDIRTRYPITEDEWTKIISAGTSAKIFRSLNGPVYYSMLYDNVGDTPVDGVLPATAEIMFEKSNVMNFVYPSAAYVWVMCKTGNGAVVVTE